VVSVVAVGRVVAADAGAGQVLGLIGRSLRLIGGLFGLVGLFLGSFGVAASMRGRGAGLVGPPLSPGDDLPVAPLVGQVGGFLGQVGGLLGPVGGLLGALGALPCLLGQPARPVGMLAGLVDVLPDAGLVPVLVGPRRRTVDSGVARTAEFTARLEVAEFEDYLGPTGLV
jgi:hypothetical protein